MEINLHSTFDSQLKIEFLQARPPKPFYLTFLFTALKEKKRISIHLPPSLYFVTDVGLPDRERQETNEERKWITAEGGRKTLDSILSFQTNGGCVLPLTAKA